MKIILLTALALTLVCAPGRADLVKFESGPGLSLLDGDVLTIQISGLTFSNAVISTAGISLNEFEAPPHSGVNVVMNSGDPLSVTFNHSVASIGAFVTYGSPLTLTAYDSLMNVVASASSVFGSNFALSGDAGSAPNEFLGVAFAGGISTVAFSDASAYSFVIDDLTFTSSTTIVPEPSSWVLLGSSALLAAALRRRSVKQ